MSTIKVDTYLTRGGASEIAIDKLKGASSAGSMTVVGEGGSTTTNLQQGLAKQWCNYNQGYNSATVEFRDSFNTSSLTDNGTGDFTITINNNMTDGNYSHVCDGNYNLANGNYSNTTGHNQIYRQMTTTAYDHICLSSNNPYDYHVAMSQIMGDLA